MSDLDLEEMRRDIERKSLKKIKTVGQLIREIKIHEELCKIIE